MHTKHSSSTHHVQPFSLFSIWLARGEMRSVDAVRHGVAGGVDDVGQDARSDSCAMVGDGGGKGRGVCQGGGVAVGGRGGGGVGQGSCERSA